MLSRRILSRGLSQVAPRYTVPRASFSQLRTLRADESEDPFPDGKYPNPPRVKRQFRDPYGEWWDKQERRNFGEPIHEDNDILGVFSPEQHTHVAPAKGLFHIGCFVAAFLGVCGVVSLYYPDKPSIPRTFPDGLEKELGGPGAVSARKPGQETW
ncbi:NADH ubiquinone oxidoreductase [Aspergillus sclerotialis]|uniref:NADH ubiquinone oxidoreductase n=1 Tax=Aspergillus sclerotialis TaxID=2070753 RepID=A0A3A2Z9B4_9EURO|nr:NADH ubiquinone oxidoreductase [Aspergillus sclerotialis]